MSNKMLIDASHPEETRVAVVRGNRIEEFDFESQEKKQLRGNIYLAKVTRVEPSLQAAFVDYGGNRHGFLAFSEIHPDYYQIPVADRQALLDAEAAEARAHREAEEQDVAEDDETSGEAEEDAPKKKPRRRRSRKAKSADASEENSAEETTDGDTTPSSEKSSDQISEDVKEAIEEVIEEADIEAKSETKDKPKPKRRTTRRKPAAKKKAEEATEETASNDAENDNDDDGNPTSMAAIVEMDSISEDLPDESNDGDDSSDDDPVAEEKPKRRTTRRKPATKKKTETVEEDTSDETKSVEAKEETQAETEQASDTNDDDKSEEKPKKRAPRRRSRKKAEDVKAEEEDGSNSSDDDDDNDKTDSDIESVGQEDALEEVPNPRRQRRHYKIQEVIKRRQVLLIQVVKEERGNKGAALTTYLSLAGRYSVLMPNTARGGGISRKITNAADRKRLKGIASKLDVPAGMGVILRTAGASRTDVEINRDFDYLMRLWGQVRNLTLSSTAPCLVYEEGSLIKRSIRDLYDKDTGEILVSGEEGFKEAKEFMGMLMPEHQKRVKQHKDSQAIFAKFGVESHLERMVSPQVTMKSGGYLVINQTEALVAVDVNSGRSTRAHSIEDTALQTNLEAAEEVARQLRLRDLAGLIVIDFIDMEEKRNNRAVEKRLKDCLKNDRARIQVGRISHFGLMEMSRQRMRSSVLESTMDVCEHCAGTGYIRSASAIALHIYRAIEEHVSRHNKFDAVVKTNREVAFHILNHKRSALLELEAKYGLNILLEGDGAISSQDFTIEKGEPASGDTNTAVIGFQNEAAFDATNADEDQENKGGRKNRGRKRRNDEDDTTTDNDESSPESNSEDDSDEDRPRRRRRRGKRGGRRNTNSEENNNTETASDDDANENTEREKKPSRSKGRSKAKDTETEKPQEENSDEDQGDSSEKKTTKRKRVTQKAPIQKKPDNADAKPENGSDDNEEPKQEPPRPARRRTTRRVTEDAPGTEAVTALSDDNSSDDKSASSSEAETKPVKAEAASSEKADEEKPAKKGWWNRGGGFF